MKIPYGQINNIALHAICKKQADAIRLPDGKHGIMGDSGLQRTASIRPRRYPIVKRFPSTA